MTEKKKLTSEFEAFRRECVDLAILINTFDALFTEESQKESYADIAPTFFADLNLWLINLYYLGAFRLLDKDKTIGRSNLTANYFVDRLRTIRNSTEEIETLLARLNCYKKSIQLARHRVVAHADLEAITREQELGAHDQSCALLFRRDLQDFCDAVGRQVGSGPSEFINIPPGDVWNLIMALREYKKMKAKPSD